MVKQSFGRLNRTAVDVRFFCFLFALVFLGHMACSQSKLTIVKKCYFPGNENFPGRNFTCQKLYFTGEELSSEINYSSNGWQVYDSISYGMKGGKYCIKSYQPRYKDESKLSSMGYELHETDCRQVKPFSEACFSQVNDQYRLAKTYLDDLCFLLKLNPKQNDSVFLFEEQIIPSLLSQYGIPYNERLNSFSFNVSHNNLIIADVFFFNNYTLKRRYQYNEHRLQEVLIVVENKQDRIISEYREYFEILN